MSLDNEGVSLPEVNRNVIELRRQVEGINGRIESFGNRFVPVSQWEESRKTQGERIGAIEKELDLRRHTFTTSFLYPALMLLIGSGVALAVTQLAGG